MRITSVLVAAIAAVTSTSNAVQSGITEWSPETEALMARISTEVNQIEFYEPTPFMEIFETIDNLARVEETHVTKRKDEAL